MLNMPVSKQGDQAARIQTESRAPGRHRSDFAISRLANPVVGFVHRHLRRARNADHKNGTFWNQAGLQLFAFNFDFSVPVIDSQTRARLEPSGLPNRLGNHHTAGTINGSFHTIIIPSSMVC